MPILQPGDTVRFISPASPPDRDGVERRATILREWGLKVEIAPHAFDKLSFLAGSDDDRLQDLIDAFVAPHVRAVLATRGGKGSYRIAHRLPFETIAANPKPVVGFSDITILHMMLWKKCALEGVHGALTSDAEDRLSETAAASLHAVLMKDGSAEIAAQTATASYELTTFGTARGPLLGGNLDMLCTAAGWALPPFRGAVLLVESAGLGIGQLDRALTMLVRGKHLESIAGIAVGHINGTPSNPPWSAIDLIRQHLGPLEVPILGGLPIGHDMDARSVPIGRTVILDADGLKLHIQG